MKRLLVVLLIVVASLSGCGRRVPDTLVTTPFDQQEMDEAIARARSEVDSFIAELMSPKGSDHAVKAPIEDRGETEHFWLTDISFSNGQFTGLIGNEPGIVSNVQFGQSWTISKNDISDWMYIRDRKMHGNYTMRPLLNGMPPEDAAKFREMFANP